MFVDKKVKKDRLDTCKMRLLQELRNAEVPPKWTKGARCGKCSCFLDAKATLTKEFFGECPLDKWKE